MARLRKIWRPLNQVIRQVKHNKPSANGYQPPSLILIKFAVQNARSTIKKVIVMQLTKMIFIFHSRNITTANRMVVISIVEVTEIP